MQSMTFVRLSANWAALWTHFIDTFSFMRSRIISASNVVRYSWHWGIFVFWIRSYKLLQSTMANASGLWDKHLFGLRHASDGYFNHSQCNLIHPNKSIAPLNAYDSDASVDPTTLAIFLEYHIKGLTMLACHSPISLDAVMIRQPFWDWAFALVAKLASEKDTNRRFSNGIGWIRILVSLWFLASCNKRFPSSRSLIWAVVIFAWRKLNRAAMSGLVLVAPYCRLPISPLNACLSVSVTRASGWIRLLLSTWIAGMSSMYFRWSRSIEKSAFLGYLNAREDKILVLFTAKWELLF